MCLILVYRRWCGVLRVLFLIGYFECLFWCLILVFLILVLDLSLFVGVGMWLTNLLFWGCYFICDLCWTLRLCFVVRCSFDMLLFDLWLKCCCLGAYFMLGLNFGFVIWLFSVFVVLQVSFALLLVLNLVVFCCVYVECLFFWLWLYFWVNLRMYVYGFLYFGFWGFDLILVVGFDYLTCFTNCLWVCVNFGFLYLSFVGLL